MSRKRKLRFPKAYISIDPISHTTSTRSVETGKFTGRRAVSVAKSDLTRVKRVIKGPYSGIIIGRTIGRTRVRGDRFKRGTLRRRL